jgi:hypothetical protein
LYGATDTISAEYDPAAHRLTADDKKQIEAAIRKHGSGALQNVTKGGAMLYLRSAMRFAGPDEVYLRHLFAPETLKEMPWDGPERICLNIRDSKKVGPSGHPIQLVESYSPFVERYYRLPYENMNPASDLIVGHQFMAMVWRKNKLQVLQQHGRIECLPREMLPVFVEEGWQGGWHPITKSSIEPGEWQQMSSDIGSIPRNGGDYLRFLLMAKVIGATKCSYREKLSLLEGMRIMCGQDGHFFAEFIEKVGGMSGLIGIMVTEIDDAEVDIEEGLDEA